MKIGKYKLSKNKLNELSDHLQKVKRYDYVNNSKEMVVLATEKYYFRHNSTQMNMIVLKNHNETTHIDIIGGAGGTGIFNISLWSEKGFIKKTKKIIDQFCSENGIIMEESNYA